MKNATKPEVGDSFPSAFGFVINRRYARDKIPTITRIENGVTIIVYTLWALGLNKEKPKPFAK